MENINYNDEIKYRGWNYRVLDLKGEELIDEINNLSRLEIIDWLQWNDPNGTYTDRCSLNEFGFIMSREEGVEIMTRQIEEQ